MIRILGAITGSALALATLLVVIGIPQFKTEGTANERAIVTLPLPTAPVDRHHPGTNTPPAGVDGDMQATNDAAAAAGPVEPPQPPVADPPIDSMAADAAPAAAVDTRAESIDPAAGDAQRVLDTSQSWYAFWSPFRSELAANGFVARLQSVTGLDYRVVRVKPGVYEVAFAYENDADINTNLTQITAATGLELPQ